MLGSLCSSRVRLVRAPGQPRADSFGLCAARNAWPLGELLSGGGFAREFRQTYRHLAVVEAREELDAERRADRDERADEVNGEREGRAVVRDVLGQAVPVVLAAPAHGQAADGAARA